MNENLMEVICILDESGSMGTLRNDTIGGFNMYLDSLREIDRTVNVTVVTFNNKHKTLHSGVNVKSLRPLNESDYKPDGGTALLDAVGHTIGDVGNRLATMAESDRPSKVIFFIQTDGEENQSREFDIEKLKSMVDVQKNTFGWEFIFAGANIDAFAAGNSYSFSAASTGNYVANAAGTNNLYRSMGVYTKNLMANTSEELAADGMTLSAVMNQVENDIKKS